MIAGQKYLVKDSYRGTSLYDHLVGRTGEYTYTGRPCAGPTPILKFDIGYDGTEGRTSFYAVSEEHLAPSQ